MAGRGRSLYCGLLSDWAKHALVLALLLLCTHSWGACRLQNQNYTRGWCNSKCNLPSTACEDSGILSASCGSFPGYAHFLRNTCCGYSQTCAYYDVYCCDTQAEADSAFCALNPTAEGCVEEAVPASCQNDYQQCISLGGVWKKISSTSSECASQCNTCDNATGSRFRNRQVDICCQKGLAPPDSAVQCYMPANSGSGMTWSTRLTAQNDEGYSCGELSTADGEAIQENQALYKRFCIDNDRYEEQVDTNDVGGSSSSGGEGSSSSEDIGHSFGTELEALGGLYGVLDTIRDTLTKRLTPATEQIRDCLYNFKLCTSMEPLQIDWTGMPRDTSVSNVDTSILKHIKPMLDSSVKLDSAQLKALRSLDTLYRKGLVNDSQMRILVNSINGNVSDVESAVKSVRHGVDSLLDSMVTYMNKVGQSIAFVGDSVGTLRGDFNALLESEGTVPGDTSWNGYDDSYQEGSDSVGNDYLVGLGGQLDSAINFSGFDSVFSQEHSDTVDWNSLSRLPSTDSMKQVLDSSISAQRSELEDTLNAAFDSMQGEFMLLNYDSLILEPLGMRVPNTNTCPDHCFTFSIDGGSESGWQSWLGGVGTLDFGVCRPLPGMNIDVLLLLRIIGRLLTAMFCIYIGLWFIAGRKN